MATRVSRDGDGKSASWPPVGSKAKYKLTDGRADATPLGGSGRSTRAGSVGKGAKVFSKPSLCLLACLFDDGA
jgi:hypothetical protein